MEIEHYFADLNVHVTLTSPKGGLVNSMSDTDADVVMQMIYMTLNCFSYSRVMYSKERSDTDVLEGKDEGIRRR